jgi:hypothetical protein
MGNECIKAQVLDLVRITVLGKNKYPNYTHAETGSYWNKLPSQGPGCGVFYRPLNSTSHFPELFPDSII